MKRLVAAILALMLLGGCAAQPQQETQLNQTQPTQSQPPESIPEETTIREIPYESRFDTVTQITLEGDSITVQGNEEAVFTSNDIVYYEDKDAYESGNPYGEGKAQERHSAQEAGEHLVVNITQPGAYQVSGQLNKGQLRIDLGDEAENDPNALVELILDNADITCTVAPAVLFMDVYECDGGWSVDTASSQVDTRAAGANLILVGENSVTGSHVAKIFKDNEEEKKLWKQDGAIYSYMSMNVYGPGSLDLTADSEGLDTELHLTINGGNIAIRSQNDGINTNEDGVSVTTINGGTLHIIAGLGEEGDGIDSNGYLVINGGTVVASANPAADAGLDSDLGSYIHGGTVVALSATMDWAESDSDQVTMNLQFSKMQSSESAVVVAREDGTVVFAYDPGADEVLAENRRQYMGAVVSCPGFQVGDNYEIYLGGSIAGTETGGVYDAATVTEYSGGTQMAYTGTDVMMRPGGMGGFGGMQKPDGEWAEGERPEIPEGGWPEGERPEIPEGGWPEGERPEIPEGGWPEGERPEMPEGGWPEGERPQKPEGEWPEGEVPEMPEGEFAGGMFPGSAQPGEANTLFYMQDKVNFFSGLTAA